MEIYIKKKRLNYKKYVNAIQQKFYILSIIKKSSEKMKVKLGEVRFCLLPWEEMVRVWGSQLWPSQFCMEWDPLREKEMEGYSFGWAMG